MTTTNDTDADGLADASGERRVLYVDADGGGDSVATRLGDQLDEGFSLSPTTGEEALDTAASGRWACLVVGDGADHSVQSALLDELGCPSILFTEADPAAVPDHVLGRVDTIVERGNGTRSIDFLAEKIVTLARAPSDLDEELSASLSTVTSQARAATSLFLVDDDGAVVWSNRSFEAAFPVSEVDTTVPETDDFYARLDALVSSLSEDGGLVAVGGEGAPDERPFVVSTADRARYYVYDRYPVRSVADGLTLERFEDVTDRVHEAARSRRLELLVEQAQDGLYTLDRNGVIDFCNESFAANLGYEREALIGEHAAVALAPGELEIGQETVQYLLDNPDQDSTEVDMTFLTASGEEREMSIHYTLLPTEDDTYGGLMGVVRDVTERNRRERELRESRERLRTVVENLPVVLFVADPDGTITFAEGTGLDAAPEDVDTIVGLTLDQIEHRYPEVASDLSRALDGEQVDAIQEVEGRAYHTTYQPVFEDGRLLEIIGVTSDVTERRERESRIEHQRDELSTLNRTNGLVQEIIGALGGAASRDELQQIVCDRLVEADRYGLAWIGERQGASDVLVPLTSAGEATAYLDDIEIRADESQSEGGPVGRAYRSATVQVVSDIRTADRFAPWRDRAVEAGLASMAAIPLRHGETTHGVLAVYATEPDAFSERITESFAVLGETIGLALTAVQNKRLLQRDAMVTLEFRSRSDDACLVWLASACDSTLDTAGAVETDDGVIQYLRVEGASPECVAEAVRESDRDSDASVTRTEGDRIVEIHGTSSLSVALSDVGARVRRAIARPDGVWITAEASVDADVRAIQDVVERFNPDTELVSKTECTEPFGDESEQSPLSALTDRQREVLRAAYLAGYYDWPRETTAEELAASLDIAAPTLHQHLRRAERNLLGGLLDR